MKYNLLFWPINYDRSPKILSNYIYNSKQKKMILLYVLYHIINISIIWNLCDPGFIIFFSEIS